MRRRLSSLLLLILLACLLLSLPAGAAGASEGKTRVTAVILGDMTPFSYIDATSGAPAGFGVDVLNGIAARAGLQVDYRTVNNWQDAEEALLKGSADIVPGISVTDYRRTFIAFTAPFETFGITINIRADSTDIEKLADLAGRRVGAIRASQASLLLKGHPDIHLVLFDSFHNGLFDLLAGRIDAFLIPNNIFNGLARQIGVENRVRSLSPPISEIKRAFGVRKDDTRLLQLLNTHLDAFITSPEYAAIYAKWFGKPKSYWDAPRVAAAMGGLFLLVIMVLAVLRYRSITTYNRQLQQTIAERQRAEGELQERKERLKLLLSSTAEAIYGLDLEGRCTFANPSCLRMLGYDEEQELLGKNMHELVHHSRCDGSPFPESECALLGAVRDGQCLHVDGELFWRADGTSFMVEYWAHPILKAGTLVGGVVTFLDITARKKLEAALATNERYLHSVFNEAGDAIYVADERGSIVDCNQRACEALGYSRDELLQLSVTDIDELQDPKEPLTVVGGLGRGKVVTIEGRHRRKDGTSFPVEIRIALLETGGQQRIMGFARDISERKQAEEAIRALNLSLEERVAQRTAQLARSNRELESFCYSVSHDLRAPLRHINSFATLLLEDHLDGLDAGGQDILRRIRTSSSQMGRLIDDILSLARVSRAEMTIVTVDLGAMAAEIAAMFRDLEPQRQVRVVIADGLHARGDATLLHLALQNLIGNAWKYTAGTPETVIELYRDTAGGKNAFCLRDNGVGFDMAYHDKMFKPFERLHGTEFEGTGIGLATVQRILERHGGEIWAEGARGEGARFYFTLPDA